MRAKFYINQVIRHRDGAENITFEQLVMSAVCPATFGPNGEHEDNDFHRYTPSGSLDITITNPNLFGKFQEGEKYYLDFTRADVIPAEVAPETPEETGETGETSSTEHGESSEEPQSTKHSKKARK